MTLVYILRHKLTLKTPRDYKEAVVFILLHKHTLKTPRDYTVAVVAVLLQQKHTSKHSEAAKVAAKWP